MKRFITMMLALLMVLACVACAKTEEPAPAAEAPAAEAPAVDNAAGQQVAEAPEEGAAIADTLKIAYEVEHVTLNPHQSNNATANAAYGMARGRSMAAHARENGDPLDMASYFAYGEWKWADGFEKHPVSEPDHLAYRVLRCPWCNAWNEAGLTAYGKYYCKNVDESILKGFSEDLRLDLRHRLSEEPDQGCEFHWLCAGVDGEADGVRRIAERIGDRYKKGFLYHCAQLYAVLADQASALGEEAYAELLEGVHRIYLSQCGAMSLLKVMGQAKELRI